MGEVEASRGLVLVASVTDRFGDSGLVAAAVATICDFDRYSHLDNLVMSCRVLGRGVETALLGSLERRFLHRSPLYATYVATERNASVSADFFARHGFSCCLVNYPISSWALHGHIPTCDHAEIEDIP